MEKISHIIGFAEKKFDAVCDGYKIYPEQVVMELRVVRETFEYACLVIIDRDSLLTLDYEWLWEWHIQKPTIHKKPEVPKQQTVVWTTQEKPIRRKMYEQQAVYA